jgi:hypothetical protein
MEVQIFEKLCRLSFYFDEEEIINNLIFLLCQLVFWDKKVDDFVNPYFQKMGRKEYDSTIAEFNLYLIGL